MPVGADPILTRIPGEKFSRLIDISVYLTSLQVCLLIKVFNLPKHLYKRWGETDFVIVARTGLLLLDVKGGNVQSKKKSASSLTTVLPNANGSVYEMPSQFSAIVFSLNRCYPSRYSCCDLSLIFLTRSRSIQG